MSFQGPLLSTVSHPLWSEVWKGGISACFDSLHMYICMSLSLWVRLEQFSFLFPVSLVRFFFKNFSEPTILQSFFFSQKNFAKFWSLSVLLFWGNFWDLSLFQLVKGIYLHVQRGHMKDIRKTRVQQQLYDTFKSTNLTYLHSLQNSKYNKCNGHTHW
jgi:hypothetical protein